MSILGAMLHVLRLPTLAERTRELFVFDLTLIFTRSRTAASKCPSGTDPGGHVSRRKDRRCIPLKTHCVATSRRSFSTTNSDSREVSRNSTELRRLRSEMGILRLSQEISLEISVLRLPVGSSMLPSLFFPFFSTNLLNLSSTRRFAF